MTLSDPLLRELKGHIITLVNGPEGNEASQRKTFGDENETVFLLCHCLESIFLKGLVRYDGFTPWKADCFQWFYQIVRKYQKVIPLTFKTSFEDVLNDKKVKTHIGRTRLLIRTCLRRKCLHVPLQFHVENKDYNDLTLRVIYRPNASILGHEILSEIFYSLLLQLSTYDFTLDLSNSAFLDESWQLPALVKTEMVPCTRLGLTLGFPLGFPVVVTILEHSAAAELGDQIEIGDILDEINGICLRNMYGSKIDALFKKIRAEPFKMSIIKGKDPKTSQVYLPVIKLYRILGLNPPYSEYNEHPQQLQQISGINSTENVMSNSTNQQTIEQDPVLLDLSCDDDVNDKEKTSASASCATIDPTLNNSIVNHKRPLTATDNNIDLLGSSNIVGAEQKDDDNDGLVNPGCFWEQTVEEEKRGLGNLPRLPLPLPPLKLRHDHDQPQNADDEQIESPPHGFDRKQVPISKFYGEEGDQFLV